MVENVRRSIMSIPPSRDFSSEANAPCVDTDHVRIPQDHAIRALPGVQLASFGAFWVGEGLGFQWPGADLSILGLAAVVLVASLLTIAVVRRTPEATTARRE